VAAMSWEATFQATLGPLELDVSLGGGAAVVVAIIGPNGAGKTTVLRALAGTQPVRRGRFVVGDTTLASGDGRIDLPPERRQIGYVPQGFGLFGHLDVLDNVAFGLSTGVRRRPRPERRAAAAKLLDELDAAHLVGRPVSRLSGGELQRVALARALLVQPRMLLLDEPLAALDVSARRSVRTFLADKLGEVACPAVLVSHDLRDVAALADYVYVLERGRIVQHGTLSALRDAPTTPFVREFVDVEVLSRGASPTVGVGPS